MSTFVPLTTGHDILKSSSGMTRLVTFKLKVDKDSKEIVTSKSTVFHGRTISYLERPSELRGRIVEYGCNLLKAD